MSDETATRSLRDQHREHTRGLIMRALAEIIAEQGVHSFTVQDVADRAGVSHRTIYRHFPTRESLLEEQAEWLDEQIREHGAPSIPSTIEEGIDSIPMIFELFEQYHVLVRALVVIYATTKVRPRTREERSESFARLIREELPEASETERRRLFAATRAMASMQTWFFLRHHLGYSSVEAGESVRWAIRTLVDDVRTRNSATGAGHDADSERRQS